MAETMFIPGSLRDVGVYRWQRALLSIGNYLLPRGRNYSFLVNSLTDEAGWKRLLRGTGPMVPEARAVLRQLWDRLSPESPIRDQLDGVIAASQNLNPWQHALVHCPEAFEYCGNNCLRWDEAGNIYLLKRFQMNGTHAELFTYCLYHSLNSRKDLLSVLQPTYESAIDTYSEPHIQLHGQLSGKSITFRVDSQGDQYRILLEIACDDLVPDLGDNLKQIGFLKVGNFLQMLSARSNIEKILKQMDIALQEQRGGTTVHA